MAAPVGALLATNNSILSTADLTAELPEFISVSANASGHPQQRVQELFDNTGGWRQARVDLSDFAGASDLQLRFDFSTAGTMNQGTPGDEFGDFFDISRAQQNNFDGAFIDDIMIGFAERGEMVTGPSVGEHFLRRAAESGSSGTHRGPGGSVPVGDSTRYRIRCNGQRHASGNRRRAGSSIPMIDMVESLLRLGDQNVEREQGQTSDRVEHSAICLASTVFGSMRGCATRPVHRIRVPCGICRH